MSTRTYGGRTAEQIKAAAQAATPGPWETHPRGGMGYDVDPVESGLRGMVDRAEDAAHIAASNPAAVLDMLAHITELEAEAARANSLAEQAVRQAFQASRAVLEAEARMSAAQRETQSADNLIALQTAVIRAARAFCEQRTEAALIALWNEVER